MTAFTATARLAFPEPDERPCDLAPVTQAAAEAIEAKLLELQALQKRFLPAVPAVIISLAPGLARPDEEVDLGFDGVVVDTDDVVDVAENKFRFQLERSGMYLLIGGVTMGGAFETTTDTWWDLVLAQTVFGPDTEEVNIPTGGSFFEKETVMSVANGPSTRSTVSCAQFITASVNQIGVWTELVFTADANAVMTNGTLMAVWLRDELVF